MFLIRKKNAEATKHEKNYGSRLAVTLRYQKGHLSGYIYQVLVWYVN